jgi:two-component system chemotaxis response regulator CheB
MSLKVLVVDDSVVFRRVVAEALASLPEVQVVGTASNGRLALQRVRELRPDLITLDMEMPEMDGLAVLDALRKAGETAAVIVVSAVTRQGGHLTMRALDKGAFDFITKPESSTANQSQEAIRRELTPRIRALQHRMEVRAILRRPVPATGAAPGPQNRPTSRIPAALPPDKLGGIAGRMNRLATAGKPELVLIGVSTGGPAALGRLLPALPRDLGVPVLIVQHMPPVFTQSLADSLATRCAIKVREAIDGETVEAGTAYIAPGGRQMRLAPSANGSKVVQITDDPPENNCRPAVDYLFRSVANHFPGRATAVILTGMGSDGTVGLRLLKRHGCFVIAQDAATCVVFGMPKAAADAGVTDVMLPLDSIAPRITSTVRGTSS